MSLENLNNLVKTGHLKKEPYDQAEFDGLLTLGINRLKDANIPILSIESKFDLAYNASHALSLAALRFHGYRTDKRYIVFQVLEFTANLSKIDQRVLNQCHDKRNLAEYEGNYEVDQQLLTDLLRITALLLTAVEGLHK